MMNGITAMQGWYAVFQFPFLSKVILEQKV